MKEVAQNMPASAMGPDNLPYGATSYLDNLAVAAARGERLPRSVLASLAMWITKGDTLSILPRSSIGSGSSAPLLRCRLRAS